MTETKTMTYVQMCEEGLARASRWDMSHRMNRAGFRQVKRRLWWARHGLIVSILIGNLLGVALGVGLAYLMISWGWFG